MYVLFLMVRLFYNSLKQQESRMVYGTVNSFMDSRQMNLEEAGLGLGQWQKNVKS